ncbi:MAG: hypothetical protein KatS3mg121_0518 [Gammaproteobacteria bacterium]|nr:MAG: hypothetical protein KatS3mg121_0518 [Gammaproteobacteria bacterium]
MAVAEAVAEEFDATVVNMRFVKPLDEALLREIAAEHALLVTLEENAVAGGAGSAVNEALQRLGLPRPVLNLGLPDRFLEHGSREELLAEAGLDAESLRRRLAAWRPGAAARAKRTA